MPLPRKLKQGQPHVWPKIVIQSGKKNPEKLPVIWCFIVVYWVPPLTNARPNLRNWRSDVVRRFGSVPVDNRNMWITIFNNINN